VLGTLMAQEGRRLSRSKIGFGLWPAGLRPPGCVHLLVDQAVKNGFSADLPCVDFGHGGAGNAAFAPGTCCAMPWCGLAVL
jgi:hypothetical protein